MATVFTYLTIIPGALAAALLLFPLSPVSAAADGNGAGSIAEMHDRRAMEQFAQAVKKFAQEDYEGVIALMRANLAMPEVRKDDYLAASCNYYLGGAYRGIGDMGGAIEHYAAAAAGFGRVNIKAVQRDCLVNIASILEMQARFGEAAEKYRQAVALDEAGEEDERRRADVRDLARMLEKAGDSDGALEVWRTLLREMERRGDSFNQGECCFGIAGIYERRGESGTAAEFREKGQQLQRELFLRGLRRGFPEVDAFFLEASRKKELQDGAGAYKAYEAMLAEARKRGFKNGMLNALRMLAYADSNAGRKMEALRKMKEALALAREEKDGVNEGATLAGLGIFYVNLRDYANGLDCLERALEINARTGWASNEMETLNGLRLVYSALGDFRKALEMNARMLEIARRTGRKRDMLAAENSIGRFYGEIGDAQAAVEHYRRTLELSDQLGDHVLTAQQLNEYGIALMNAGDPDGAISAFRKSLAIREWPAGHVNLAEALLFKGDLEGAAGLLRPISSTHLDLGYYYLRKNDHRRARETYMSQFPAGGEHRSVDFLGFTKPVDQVFAARTGLGLSYEGLKEYYKAAYHYKEAQKLLERQRDELSLEHRLRFMGVVDWMMPHLEPYEGMVRISEFLPGGLRESLYHAEHTRGRLFAESAARSYGAPDAGLPAELAERERELNREVALAAADAEAARRSTDPAAYQRLDAGLTVLKAKRALLVEELRLADPLYAAAHYPTPLRAEEFELRPDEVLVEFEVTDPYTKVFLVKGGRIVLSYDVPLSRRELTGLVRKYRSYFEKISGFSELAAYDPRLGKKLYDLLLRPALEAEEDGGPLVVPETRVIVAPDEILSILPFESLVVSLPARPQAPSGRFGPAPVGVRYVSDIYDIAYAHSATALTVRRRLKPRASPTRELLVLADPIFSPADGRLRGTALAGGKSSGSLLRTMGGAFATMGPGGTRRAAADTREIGEEDSLFPRLDRTSLLALALRDKVFRGRPSEVLIGSAAAKSGLIGRDLSAYRYLVIATHGILDNMLPGLREPALVLTQFGNPDGDNGLLTMSEVMRLRLNADVVALTACQTGLGDHLTGEGVMGLGRAFQHAGARNVLVSLWNVAEGSTTMLAERFFAHLKEGGTMRQALRLARMDVRRAGYEHPFYWAPFILVGE